MIRDEKLIVFAKTPRAGTVKTRLAESIGEAAAGDAYRLLVDTLLRRIERLVHVELRITPDDGITEAHQWLRRTWLTLPQGPGNLGERLQRAFEAAFVEGTRRAVVIGSDCPYVTPEDIEAAWLALTTNDLVLGPSTDGGYWLIGLSALQPSLFDDIPWSTDRVFQETLSRAKNAGLRVHRLRELTDVDTEPQWREFIRSEKHPRPLPTVPRNVRRPTANRPRLTRAKAARGTTREPSDTRPLHRGGSKQSTAVSSSRSNKPHPKQWRPERT